MKKIVFLPIWLFSPYKMYTVCYLNDIFTVPVNLAGLPALSMPAGVDKQGHPLGLQLIGKALDEQKILNIGYAFEKNCGFKNEIKKWW